MRCTSRLGSGGSNYVRQLRLSHQMMIKGQEANKAIVTNGYICRLRNAMCVIFRAVSIVSTIMYSDGQVAS